MKYIIKHCHHGLSAWGQIGFFLQKFEATLFPWEFAFRGLSQCSESRKVAWGEWEQGKFYWSLVALCAQQQLFALRSLFRFTEVVFSFSSSLTETVLLNSGIPFFYTLFIVSSASSYTEELSLWEMDWQNFKEEITIISEGTMGHRIFFKVISSKKGGFQLCISHCV